MPRWLTLLILALAMTVVVASLTTMWIVVESQRAAESRQERRIEAVEEATGRIIDEIRQPGIDGGDSREETFDRIRQLCEIHDGCDP